MNHTFTHRSFSVGQVVITPAAREELHPEDVAIALNRHTRGDWGDCNRADARENEVSLTAGMRLLSVYHDRNRAKFWIITEADRSSTCILLPNEY